MKCILCGKKINEIGGYLQRVNPKGQPGVWECRPSCNADLPKETSLLLAIESDGTEIDHARGRSNDEQF